ncbi:MAG: hypothetical protein U1F43_01545 [Myxococcota bacterium]
MDFHRIRRVVAASALALAAAACATTPPLRPTPDAPTTFDSDAVAHVVRVIDEHTIVVGRGARDGFLLNGAHDVAPRPAPTPAHPTPAVRFGIRSAVADVVTLGPDETTLTVRNVVEPVRPGDYLAYTARVPVALEDDPVTRCALLDVGMLTLDDKRPLLVLSSLLEGGKPASEATLAAMVKEVNDHADLAAEVHNVPFDGGRFVGLTMSQAFRQTTRDDMLAFVDFVATFPGKYLTWDWKLVEIYGTWIVNRAPHGDSLFLKKQVSPLESAARAAVRAHDWKAAAAGWRQILAIDPNHAGAKAGLDHIEALSRAETMLAVDPDERQVQWDRAKALSDLDLDADALQAFEALIAAGYRSDDAHRQRAFALAGLGRWADAEAELTGILAGRHDAGLGSWLAYVRAQQRLAAARGAGSDEAQAEQQLVLGQVHENDEAWSAAATAYRRALDLATTPELRERAKIGQLRVTRRDGLGELRRFVATDIGDHDIASTRARRPTPGRVRHARPGRRRGRGPRPLRRPGRRRAERDVQAEWLTRLVLRRPKDPDPWTKLGWCQLARGRTADGMNAFERALGVAPNDLWARTSKAWSLVAIGRWDDALALARPGAGDDGQLALIMARASIGKGDLAAGRDWARTAVERDALGRGGARGRAARGIAGAPRRDHDADERAHAHDARAADAGAGRGRAPRAERRAARRGLGHRRALDLARARRLGAPGRPPRGRLDAHAPTRADAGHRAGRLRARRLDREPARAGRGAGGRGGLRSGAGAHRRRHRRDHRRRSSPGRRHPARRARARAGRRARRARHDRRRRRRGALGLARRRQRLRRGARPLRPGRRRGQHRRKAAYDEVRVLSSGGRRDAARALGDTFLERARADKNPLSVLDFEILRGRNDAADGDAKALEAAYDRHLAVCRASSASTRGGRAHAARRPRDHARPRRRRRGRRRSGAGAVARPPRRPRRAQRDRAPGGAQAHARRAAPGRDAGRGAVARGEPRGRRREQARGAARARHHRGRLGRRRAARRWFRAAYAAAERTDDAPSRVAAFGLGGVALDLDGDKAAAATEPKRARRVFEAHKAIPEAIEVTIMQARAESRRALALTEGLVERARDLGRDLLYAEALTAARARCWPRSAPPRRARWPRSPTACWRASTSPRCARAWPTSRSARARARRRARRHRALRGRRAPWPRR